MADTPVINVPEDVRENDHDIYMINFCRAFGDINKDAERTKPIRTLEYATRTAGTLSVDKYPQKEDYNYEYSKPLIEKVIEQGYVPPNCKILIHAESNVEARLVVPQDLQDEDTNEQQNGLYVHGEYFQYNF